MKILQYNTCSNPHLVSVELTEPFEYYLLDHSDIEMNIPGFFGFPEGTELVRRDVFSNSLRFVFDLKENVSTFDIIRYANNSYKSIRQFCKVS